ncbi:hypothetical protein AS156_08790 [Bradyrhizobium macuxiense]|uniref:Uncharacterized protein n=1 Tax=Bradyrhizobium macuxiense TaxID=1755647 RepID=A0A109JQ10_9BRAD|nr:hypothetical protein [Bradyrhizobium macuxiense]KWV53067.1 hypothetical protein AS156_08790 [Bradyrhizobium macuxiense]
MIEEASDRKERPGGGGAADHGIAPESCCLSVRAMNVLKELAVELTGEVPPKTGWSPSDELLRGLTARHLATARNCGPQTMREIVDWAEARGISIPSPHHAGKSLSEVWGDLIERASAGRLTKSEITEALEKSIRRRSPRIPVAFQIILLKILSSSYDQWPQP